MWQEEIEKNLVKLKENNIIPYDFQTYGIDEALDILENYCFTLLDYDMGLGKSISALLIAAVLRKRCHIDSLILVCPKNLINTWIGEIQKVYLKPYYIVYDSIKSKKDKWTNKFLYLIAEKRLTPIFIINIESFSRNNKCLSSAIDYFLEERTPYVVLDECSWIKNIGYVDKRCREGNKNRVKGSKRTYNIIEYFKNINFKTGLTGTLIGKSPLDIYTQMSFT